MSRLASLLLPTMINDVITLRPKVFTFHGTEPNRTLSTKAWTCEGAKERFENHLALVTPVERDRIHGWIVV